MIDSVKYAELSLFLAFSMLILSQCFVMSVLCWIVTASEGFCKYKSTVISWMLSGTWILRWFLLRRWEQSWSSWDFVTTSIASFFWWILDKCISYSVSSQLAWPIEPKVWGDDNLISFSKFYFDTTNGLDIIIFLAFKQCGNLSMDN